MPKAIGLLAIVLLTLALSGQAFAGCALCVDSVSAQTRDGAEWKPGRPVLLVFEVSRTSTGVAFPDKVAAVVMELDRERIKCLDVQLRQVAEQGDGARYAGVFYPFRAGDFDGKVDLGGDPQEFVFTVADTDVSPSPAISSSTAASSPAPVALVLVAFVALTPLALWRLAKATARRGHRIVTRH